MNWVYLDASHIVCSFPESGSINGRDLSGECGVSVVSWKSPTDEVVHYWRPQSDLCSALSSALIHLRWGFGEGCCICIPYDSLWFLSSILCSLRPDAVGLVLNVSLLLFSFSWACVLAQCVVSPSNPGWQLSNYCGGWLCPRHSVLNESCAGYRQETGEFYF